MIKLSLLVFFVFTNGCQHSKDIWNDIHFSNQTSSVECQWYPADQLYTLKNPLQKEMVANVPRYDHILHCRPLITTQRHLLIHEKSFDTQQLKNKLLADLPKNAVITIHVWHQNPHVQKKTKIKAICSLNQAGFQVNMHPNSSPPSSPFLCPQKTGVDVHLFQHNHFSSEFAVGFCVEGSWRSLA